MTQPPFPHQLGQAPQQPAMPSAPYMQPAGPYAQQADSYAQPPAPYAPPAAAMPNPYAPPAPTYPQNPYAPQAVYPQFAYKVPAYPQSILPPPKVPKQERENEIYWGGYKESADYPPEKARKERIIARIILFSVIALLLAFFFTPITHYIFPEKMPTLAATFVTFAFEIILIVTFSLLLRHAFPQGLKDALGLKKTRKEYLLIGVGSAYGAFAIAVIGSLIVVYLGGDLTKNPRAEQYAEMPHWQFLIFLFICAPILAPLFEELLFRGVLVGSAVRAFPGKAGFFVAIILTGLVFGSLHFPSTFDIVGAWVVILISSLGMFFAWLRLKLNSSIVTMATHAFYNGTLSIIQLAAGQPGMPDMFFFLN